MLSKTSQHSKRRLNNQLVMFEVEENTYQELRHGFESWSDSSFPDMFATPHEPSEGTILGSAENPILLSGCTSIEFESFLEVMYPGGDITPRMLKKEEWVGVLKLSRLWNMPRLSAVVIENLKSFNLTPIEQITLGKAYKVPGWIKEAYTTIIGDASQMSLEALGSFGWETAARVLWAVKEVYAKSHPHLTTSKIVQEILEEEFRVPVESEKAPESPELSPSTEPALDYTPFEVSASPGSLRTTVTQAQPVPGRAGVAGIIGFGVDGVYVSRNSTQGPDLVIRDFAEDAGGWRIDKHVRMVGDTTGSGLSDIIGFGNDGVYISRNLGDGTFGRAKLVVNHFGYEFDAGGWRVTDHIRYAVDLRKKGRVDFLGFGETGVFVSLNNGDGTFGPVRLALGEFGYCAGNWRIDRHLRFLVDVTGNGLPDIVGFGESSVVVALNNGDGTFQKAKPVLGDFTYSTGIQWRVNQHPRTVADMTGDGRADIVAFSENGVHVALNIGDGTFHPPVLIMEDLKLTVGWADEYPRFVADLTGDGRGDVIVFGQGGVYISLNNGDATFQPVKFVLNGFGYSTGWRVQGDHLRLVVDLTGDGAADIIGFKEDGVWVSYNDGKGNFSPLKQLHVGCFPSFIGDWSRSRTVRWVTNLYG